MDPNHETGFSPFDLANGAAEKISPPPDFDGPVRNRRMTDPLCLLVLLGVWGVATWIGIWSLQEGNYDIFVHTADYKGRICGVDDNGNGDVLPPLLHAVDHLSNGICVDECPTQYSLEPTSRSDLFCKDDADLLAMEGCISGTEISNDPDTLITCGGCMYVMGVKKMKNQCVPGSVDEVINKVNEVAEGQGLEPLAEWTRFKGPTLITRIVNDLHTARYILIGAIVGSALAGLLVLMLHLFPKCIPFTVWVSAFLVPCVHGGGGTLLWFLSSTYEIDQTGIHSDFKALVMKILAITLWSFAGVFLLSVIFLRKRMALSISLTKAGTRAIREVKLCILFPVLQSLLYVSFLGTFTLWFIYLSTTGVFVEETETVFGNDITYTFKQFTTFDQYKFWFMILVFFWTSSVFIAFGRMILSLCFAQWYFTPEKDEGNVVSMCTVIFTTVVKHAGTVAFASLAVGPVAIIRAPFLFLQKCIRRSGMSNTCIDALICSCQCGLFILERFMKFTSNNVFVHTALFGFSFCKSSHESYYMIKRNAQTVSDAGPVGFLSTFFTRVLLCSGTCVTSYYVLDVFYADDLFSILFVTAVIGLITWFIAGFFMETVGVSVTTLFHCFLADEEMLGNLGSLYVPNEIDEFLTLLDHLRTNKSDIADEIGIDDFTVDSGIMGKEELKNDSVPKRIL